MDKSARLINNVLTIKVLYLFLIAVLKQKNGFNCHIIHLKSTKLTRLSYLYELFYLKFKLPFQHGAK